MERRSSIPAALVAGVLATWLLGAGMAQGADLLQQPHDNYAGGVAGFRDIPYQVISGYHPQTADLYLPTRDKAPHPAVVYVHGGGWGLGSPRMGSNVAMLSNLAARGFVVMGINYRFHGEAKFPAQIQDVKAAIRWLRSNAAEYGVDTARIGIWGESAGGYLAALAGTSCGVAALEPKAAAGGPGPGAAGPGATGAGAAGAAPRPAMPGMVTVNSDPKQSDCVQAVVDWYGPVDFPSMDKQSLAGSMQHAAPTSAESQLLGCTLAQCPAALVASSNPITYIDNSDPPFLIMHGDSDHSVPSGQSSELQRALATKGVKVRLVLEPGLDHGFAGASDARLKEIWQVSYDFLGATLAGK
ncbi:MAG: alpha/beta hydrolase [Steroidobacteraceae bacterium]